MCPRVGVVKVRHLEFCYLRGSATRKTEDAPIAEKGDGEHDGGHLDEVLRMAQDQAKHCTS